MDLEGLLRLPALSVRQPWAAYIVAGIKCVELRNWRTDYRGWLWIHAGKQPDLDAMEIYGLDPHEFSVGGLVGLGLLSECEPIRSPAEWTALRNDHRSPGTFMPPVYAWRLSDVIALDKLVPCRGELRLFHLREDARDETRKSLTQPVHEPFLESATPI